MLALWSLFTGFVLAFVGAYLQHRSWSNKYFTELFESERTEAISFVSSLSEDLDARLMAQRAFIGKAYRGNVTDAEIQAHKDALSRWMGKFSSNKSKIRHLFGFDKMVDFEYEVHRRMRDVSFIAARGLHLGKENLAAEDRKVFNNLEANLNISQHHAYQFLKELNDQISAEDIGRLRNRNNLQTRDHSLIEISYLIKRLFGSEATRRRRY